MAISPDGSAVAAGFNVATVSPALTTTQSADIIVVVVDFFTSHPSSVLVSGISSANTTGWTRRFQANGGSPLSNLGVASTFSYKEVWYGKAAGPLTGESIAVALSNTGPNTYISVSADAFHGVDQTTIWDVNSSLPASTSHAGASGSTSHNVTGISTTAVATCLIAALGGNQSTSGGQVTFTADSGWTLADNNTNVNGFQSQGVEFKTVSAAQASVTQDVFTGFSLDDYIAYVDAMRVAPLPPPNQAIFIG